MIDSQLYIYAGYVVGKTPPNEILNKKAEDVFKQLLLAHSSAYHIVKEIKKEVKVGMIYYFQLFEEKSIASFLLRIVIDELFNWLFFDVLIKGESSIYIPPFNIKKLTKGEVAEMKGTVDWIGLNYFTRNRVSLNVKKGLVYSEGERMSNMNYEIYPEGLSKMFKKVTKRYKNIPILISENGVDANDVEQIAYLNDHWDEVVELRKKSKLLFGYTFWSLLDGLEWSDGYKWKFGMFKIDQNDPKRTRQERPSWSAFSKICKQENSNV
jgi:beta-glucosidase